MRLHCFFGKIPGEDSPELIDAWDEYTIDANESGFAEVRKKAMESKPYTMVREIVVNVSDKAVAAAFAVPTVDGNVES